MNRISNLYVDCCRFLVGPPEDLQTTEAIEYNRRRSYVSLGVGSATLMLATIGQIVGETQGHMSVLGGVSAASVCVSAMQAEGLNLLE